MYLSDIDGLVKEFEEMRQEIRELAKKELKEIKYEDFSISRREFYDNIIYNIKNATKYHFVNPIRFFLENRCRDIRLFGKPIINIGELKITLENLVFWVRRMCFFIMCLIILPISINKIRSKLSYVFHEWVLEDLANM